MKVLNSQECELLENSLSKIKGAFLRDVWSSERDVVCSLYKNSQTFYLWIDLSPSFPFLWVFNEMPPFLRKKTKPLRLFLKAHFLNQKIQEFSLLKEEGRVFSFQFRKSHSLELRLFPKGLNLIAKAEKKTISWNKVKRTPFSTENKS